MENKKDAEAYAEQMRLLQTDKDDIARRSAIQKAMDEALDWVDENLPHTTELANE